MPCDYTKYPENWKTEIRPAILKRAKNRCEWCGVENYAPHPITGSRVVLTMKYFFYGLLISACIAFLAYADPQLLKAMLGIVLIIAAGMIGGYILFQGFCWALKD